MDRIKFYKSKIDDHKKSLKRLKSKLLQISLVRLFLFLIAIFGVYFFWSSTAIVLGIILGFIILFVFFVKKYLKLKRAVNKNKLLITINEHEILALKGDYSHFKNGEIYKNSKHAFAEDIDLFGQNSFFQYINRSGLKHGEALLSDWLKSNEAAKIKLKQEAVKDLSENIEFRQNFTAEAQMLENQETLDDILKALDNHKHFIPKAFKFIPYIFSALSLSVLLLYAFEVLNIKQILLWIFVGLGITGFFLKRINALSSITAKAQELFRQYQKLIENVESQNFEAEELKQQQSHLVLNNQKASEFLKQFSKYIDALEQRQNMLVGVVFNAFLLWDLRQCYKIETWLKTHKNELKNWFDTVAYFDAKNSLANLAYNQTHFTYPEINENSNSILKYKSATHPLIPKEQAVSNDFEIENGNFLIITGANMAGKSTFLRTVSLMIVMANQGLPVCGHSCIYKPIKLITSMRTSDSLSDESSYFFSELTRLKTIVEQLEKDDYFVVLDEILKGTNSNDKAKGSQQFIEKLAKTNSSGIVATHDLSLCTLSEKLQQVNNFYFDAEIVNDELYFDYKLKNGICQNMNASFLLKKMGIV